MTYQEALDWIHGQLKFGIKPGLERMAWMLKELGNPQDNLKADAYRGNKRQRVYSQCPTNLFLPRRAMKLEPLLHPILLTSRNESLLMVR